MSKKIRLIFGIHNHQPTGNFGYVFEDTYENSYLPLLTAVENHPNICINLHYSGPLLLWLEENRPEFIVRLRKLVDRGNVEILSGAFYEPILPGIPEKDRIGQIIKQNQFIRNTFGYESTGMWLAEKVWEPDLPKTIEQSKIHYIAIDEENFQLSGIDELPVKGYYNTENEGHTIGVFSISKVLRDMLVSSSPGEVLDYLKTRVSDNQQDAYTIIEDGEKFHNPSGEDSGTFWIDSFFTLLEENSDWIKTCTFNKYWKNVPPLGIAYFPSGSYLEMEEWALPAEHQIRYSSVLDDLRKRDDFDEIRPFIRGGVWRNFMTKYSESNWMQKRIQQVSRKFHLLESRYKDRNRLRKIRDSLWAATCNDVYWHGHFGGIYLPHLRNAVWSNLIRAEKQIEEKLYNLSGGRCIHNESDIDRDGLIEVQLSNKTFSAVFSQRNPGAIIEYDYRPTNFNIFDSVQRHEERYHKYIEENREAGSSWYYNADIEKDALVFDSRPRLSLLDRYFDGHISLEGVAENKYNEACDFVNEAVDICNKNCDKTLSFEQKGWINWQRSKVKKEIVLNSTGFDTNYVLSNIGMGMNEFLFGPEFNFSLHSGQKEDKTLFINKKKFNKSYLDSSDINSVTHFSIKNKDKNIKIDLTFSKAVRLLIFPHETVVLTQNGFEKIYQSTTVLPLWEVKMNPGKMVSRTLKFKIEALK